MRIQLIPTRTIFFATVGTVITALLSSTYAAGAVVPWNVSANENEGTVVVTASHLESAQVAGSHATTGNAPYSNQYTTQQPAVGTGQTPAEIDLWELFYRKYPRPYDYLPRRSQPATLTRPETESIVRNAVLTMQLSSPEIVFDPDPSVNEWNAWAVYLPVWLVTHQSVQTTTITEDGITIDITATPSTTRFDMGDGTTVSCRAFTPRPRGTDPWTPSPTCGHSYDEPGSYTVTATTHWSVSWAANGYTGSLTSTTSSSRPLEVKEFVSIIIE